MKNLNEKVLLTGANGLVGRALCEKLLMNGFELVVLGRKDESLFRKEFSFPCQYYQWENPNETKPPKEALNVSHVIHLMGEPIADRKWNEEIKKSLQDSRIKSTKNLVEALNPLSIIKTFVSASAIGIYGSRGDEELSEKSLLSDCFLGQLCQDWEKESKNFNGRSVQLRFGVVLSHEGGALKKMLPAFESGVGGKLGSGEQWMSVIHMNDLVKMIIECLTNEKFVGPINAVCPEPLKNKDFTNALCKAMKVSGFFTVPEFVLKTAFGEMSSVLLSSQRVLPLKAKELGFIYEFKNINEILSDLFYYKTSSDDFLFTATQWVPKQKEEIFDFFSDENNLEKITPPFLNFNVVGKNTQKIEEGTEIDYKLKIHGVPAKWKSKILDWKKGISFKDIQLKGPYSKWEHTHGFYDCSKGTLLTDHVIFRLPFSQFGGNLAKPFIKMDVQKIFNYRKKIIDELFNSNS